MHRPTTVVHRGGSTAGAILVVGLTAIVLIGVWLFVLAGGRSSSVTVNPQTDNAVPTVERQAPSSLARVNEETHT